MPPVEGGEIEETFSPLDINGLNLWLDASDTTTITQTGGNVSQWADKSGNEIHSFQNIASKQPQTNLRNINLLNGIKFNGTSNYLELPTGSYDFANKNITLLIVCFPDSYSSVENNVIAGAPTTQAIRFGLRLGQNLLRVYNAVGGQFSQISLIENNEAKILGMMKNNDVNNSIYNGSFGNDGFTNNFLLGSLNIGGSARPTPAYFFDGVFGEIIVYEKALSTNELNEVGEYLANKWGIIWNEIN